MDHDAILSFRAPLREPARVDAVPSPVLELAYALYFVSSAKRRRENDELDWLTSLEAQHGSLLEAIETFWQHETTQCTPGNELFVLACQLGYVRDADPRRFLRELPQLPDEGLQVFRRLEEKAGEKDDPETHGKLSAIRSRIERLREDGIAGAYGDLLERLWSALEPMWIASGRSAVEAECVRFAEVLERGVGVLGALPPHYFARTESFAQELVRFEESGSVTVSPLYFSAGGGYRFDFDDRLFLGYGLRTETMFAKLRDRSFGAAPLFKALGDPSRLLILALLRRGDMTVGDLAAALEVAQPTVSGHLRVLREAELVSLEREGRRSFYRVDADRVRTVIEALEGLAGR